MRLTRKRAIERCKELWGWLVETGKLKEDWPGWKEYGNMLFDCFLCEYDKRKGKDSYGCSYCPLVQKLRLHCSETLYDDWDNAETPEDRKTYAALFLKELEKL